MRNAALIATAFIIAAATSVQATEWTDRTSRNDGTTVCKARCPGWPVQWSTDSSRPKKTGKTYISWSCPSVPGVATAGCDVKSCAGTILQSARPACKYGRHHDDTWAIDDTGPPNRGIHIN